MNTSNIQIRKAAVDDVDEIFSLYKNVASIEGGLARKADEISLEFYNGTIYLTLWQTDPATSIIGYTDNNGIFETSDSLSFPSALDVPLQTYTTQTGPESVGVFSIPLSVTIMAVDTVSKKYMSVVKNVIKGKNEFELTWNPVHLSLEKNAGNNGFVLVNPDTGIRVIIPKETRLYQNYPNPFN